MKPSRTLNIYIARQYVVNFLFLFCVLLGIVYLFDTVELLRRAGKREDIDLSLVLTMSLLKLPEVGQKLFPFAALFSAMYTFWNLTRRYELVVVRAAGFSVWQFLAPVIAVAIAIGVIQTTLINPASALFLKKFETLEVKHLGKQRNLIALSESGIWLRQDSQDGDVILHAEKVSLPNWQLSDVMVLFFDDGNRFESRMDAMNAWLLPGKWMFKNAVVSDLQNRSESKNQFVLKTDLTTRDIEESFASPETVSFWRLPGFIKTMEQTGLEATRLRIHYQTLLSQPLLLVSMVLLAAVVSLRPPRSRATFMMVVLGVMIGFFVFFLSSFLHALGASHQIPAILAAWSPALIMFLLGVTALLNVEDG